VYFLTKKIEFPDITEATNDGLLAVGGDLSSERLLHAYKLGIFPWYENEEPILWWCPDPRFVLFPQELKVSKSMKKLLRNQVFKFTVNQAFEQVVEYCAVAKRKGQQGTWITKAMRDAYTGLFQLGYAKSVEVWQNQKLVGGLYGVDINNGIFYGESMFTHVDNASKYAFISFIQHSNYKIIDCQLYTKHLETLGGRHISRSEFLKYL
jgi:leucyl/phenylalanyl-tRNA--protein transferase